MFIYYVIKVYVPRVRANAYHVLTTPPRVFAEPKMCLRNIWTAPNGLPAWGGVLTMEGQIIPAGGDQHKPQIAIRTLTLPLATLNSAPGDTELCPWRYQPCPGLQTLRGRAGTD